MIPEDASIQEDQDRETPAVQEDGGYPIVKPGVFPPNEKALAILKEIRERRKHSGFSKPDDSLRYLREARAGGMYGDESPVCDD